MTHGNIVSTAAAVMTVIPNIGPNDVYLAYLPLAHIFELAAEVTLCISSRGSNMDGLRLSWTVGMG